MQLGRADRPRAGHRRAVGNVDFVPIPSGGAQAALSGAKIRYVVGESLRSQWIIVVPKTINKSKTRARRSASGAGAADYDEGAAVLRAPSRWKSARTTR